MIRKFWERKIRKMAKQITNAGIVTPEGILEGKTLLYDDRIIDITDDPLPESDAETTDAGGRLLIPGLIDLHIHGYMGADASDGSEEAVRTIASGILRNGVTAFLPTTMTVSYEMLEAAFSSIRGVMQAPRTGEARVLGAHAEGPFININKKGAQFGEYVRKPDAEFVIRNKDVVKLITIAPETDEDFGAIKKIRKATDAVVSLGHTDADYDTIMSSIDAGVSHATHLFNAMTGITHRSPGAAGAALFSDKISCELICDTFHVHPALFLPVFRLKGRKLNLITDCLRAAGLPDGEYELGGQKFTLNGIECRLKDGTIAGSVLKLNKAVANLARAGVPLHEAVCAASLYPAMTLGLENERGAIRPGLRADFSLCDDELNISEVYISGKREY